VIVDLSCLLYLLFVCIRNILVVITPKTAHPNMSLTFAVQQMLVYFVFLLLRSMIQRAAVFTNDNKRPGSGRAAEVHFRCFSEFSQTYYAAAGGK
jgi:hypothetical protein